MKENMDLKLRIHYYEERLAEFRSDTNMDAEILVSFRQGAGLGLTF